MQRLAIAGLIGLGMGAALAHPAGVPGAHHAVEHLVLTLLFAVPGLMLLRRASQRHTRPRRLRVRRRDH